MADKPLKSFIKKELYFWVGISNNKKVREIGSR